ncbi:MAG: hypothetical protein A2W27_00345 [Deltaproteobacteria bacterium RBG_16_44_11]|nr:MAG: hypothetical protein A2W27_00345 [Deltaproteobacteria bacterium RBG_16_44_11]
MKQFIITPAAGKRLIGKAIVAHQAVKAVRKKGTIVIIAGTTNGYVAEELLSKASKTKDFKRDRFFRGIVLPPGGPKTKGGRLADQSSFPGDVVIQDGVWQRGKTIFDVVDDLKEGDVILKGANALDLAQRRAAILIADSKAGTIGVAMRVVVGRRVRLIIPVGLEKRISGNLDEIVAMMNEPGGEGPRLMPVPGEVFTELDAIALLTGAKTYLVSAGGVCGAEGSVWLAVNGKSSEEKAAEALIKSVADEPAFSL